MSFIISSNYDIYFSSNQQQTSPIKQSSLYSIISPKKYLSTKENQFKSQPTSLLSTKENQSHFKNENSKSTNLHSKFEINTVVSLLRSFNGDSHKVSLAYPYMSIDEIQKIKKSKSNRINYSHSLFTPEEDELLLNSISKKGENFRIIARIFKGKKSITEIKWRYKKLKMMNTLFDYEAKTDNKEREINDVVEDILYKESICPAEVYKTINPIIKRGVKAEKENENDEQSFLSLKRKKHFEECGFQLNFNQILNFSEKHDNQYNKNEVMMILNKLDCLYNTYLTINKSLSLRIFDFNSKLSNSEIEYRNYLLNGINQKLDHAIEVYDNYLLFNTEEMKGDECILIHKIDALLEISQILKLKDKLLI